MELPYENIEVGSLIQPKSKDYDWGGMDISTIIMLNFFRKESIFSIAAAVEKTLQVDTTTSNKSRPSCAGVEVEVDLMKEFPKRVNIGIRKKNKEIIDKWIHIKYDYLPKYGKTCNLQGHNEEESFVLHTDLFL